MLAIRCAALLLLAEMAVTWLLPAHATASEQILSRAVITLILATALLPLPALENSPAHHILALWSLLAGGIDGARIAVAGLDS